MTNSVTSGYYFTFTHSTDKIISQNAEKAHLVLQTTAICIFSDDFLIWLNIDVAVFITLPPSVRCIFPGHSARKNDKACLCLKLVFATF